MNESDGVSEGFRPEILRLLEMVGFANYRPAIQRLASQLTAAESPMHIEVAYWALVQIDETIPGLGLHNVNEGRSGVYRIEDRALFRGIQYVGAHLLNMSVEWLARSIVTVSCYHVESSLKRRYKVRENLSVGMILRKIPVDELTSDLRDILSLLNKAVYNQAKHTVETLEWDSHMFSVADAIAVYLACRSIGARLLKDLGITTRNGKAVFQPDEIGSDSDLISGMESRSA